MFIVHTGRKFGNDILEMSGTAVFGYTESDSEDELPAGWEERTTLDDKVYYVNHESRSTQWKHPRTGKRKILVGDLPPGWEQNQLDDGKVVFVNHQDSRTTYTDPRLAFAIEDKETKNEVPRQKYDASTKGLYILHGMDLSDKTIIITGATSGIGFETAKCLSLHNAHVVMICRDITKGEKARDQISSIKNGVNIDILECDLSSLSSVRMCARNFIANGWPLHIVILNAGILGDSFMTTENGLEKTWAVNYLSQFYLIRLLWQRLRQSAPGRIVIVSSESHRHLLNDNITHDNCDLQTFSPTNEKNYWYLEQYNLSKLCNILYAQSLNRRLYASQITVNAVHPGNIISTGLPRQNYVLRFLFIVCRPFTKSLEQASSTSIYCAIAPELDKIGGLYFNNCWFCKPSLLSLDQLLQEKLWNLSDTLIDKFESGLLGPL